MRKFSKVMIVTMAIALTLAFMPAGAFADTTSAASGTVSAKVTVDASSSWGFDMVDQTVTATSDMAEKYYPATAKAETAGKVTVADVLVAAHIAKYGAAFKNDPTAYLDMSASQYGTSMVKQFGHSIVGSYAVNNELSKTAVSASTVKDGDVVKIGSYTDKSYTDLFSYFDKDSYSAKAGSSLPVKVTAAIYDYTAGKQVSIVPETCTINTVDENSGDVTALTYKTDAAGTATVSFAAPGTYYITALGLVKGPYGTGGIMAPLAKVNVGLNAPAAKISKKKAASAKISWGKVTGASKYKVYRATKKSGKYKCVKTTTARSFINKKLKKGKHYYYKVKAVSGSYTSSYSNIVRK